MNGESGSEETVAEIRHELQVDELRRLRHSLDTWTKLHTPLIVFSMILGTLAAVMSFAAGFWQNLTVLTFVSGCIQVLCLGLQRMDQKFITEQVRLSKLLDSVLVGAGQAPLRIRRSTNAPFAAGP